MERSFLFPFAFEKWALWITQGYAVYCGNENSVSFRLWTGVVWISRNEIRGTMDIPGELQIISNGFRFVLLSPTSVELVSWFYSREWDCRKEKNSVSSRLLKEAYLNVLRGKGTTEIRWSLYPFACEKTFPGKAQGKEMVAAMRTLYPFACEKGFYWNCSGERDNC